MTLVRISRVLAGLLCLILVASASSASARGKNKGTEKASPDALRVERLLVLGPLDHPLPVFGEDADRGDKGVAGLLDAQLLPLVFAEPRAGERIRWFTGEVAEWKTATAAAGSLSLARPPEVDVPSPALAWMAVYLSTDRFVKLELRLLGKHPRRAWLDGKPIATGGVGKDDGEVKAEIALTSGQHCLLMKTVLDPSRDEAWSLGLELGGKKGGRPDLELSVDDRHDLRLREILDTPAIDSLAVSPDGTRVATSVRRILPGTDDAETWIEIRDTRAGALVESWRGGKAAGQVAWSPDGRYISYVARSESGEDDDETSTLLLYDLTGHGATPLLEGLKSLEGYTWSPSGRTIAYGVKVEAEKDKRGVKRLEGLMDRWAGYRDKQHLHLVVVPGGARRQITGGRLTTSIQDFAPDGSALLFTREVEDLSRRPYSRTELWRLDLQSFSSRKLRDFEWFGAARFSPDGGKLLIQADASAFGGAGINLDEGSIPNSYDTQLFIWDPATDEVRAITREFAPAVAAARWSHADGNVYLTAGDADFVRLFRYDPGNDVFSRLDTGVDVVRDFDLAARAPLALGVGSGVWQPQGLFAIDLRTSAARRLEHPSGEWFSRVRPGGVEEWDFTASTGTRIDGRIYLPPGFDPSRKYPGIVYYYGGTSPVHRAFGGRYPKEWWASNGYVVYVLQPSGATGYGQRFSATHVNDWGKTTTREIIEGTRRFLEAHPFVDPARVGCIGASYGGFMTMLLSTETDIFAAAVSHAGISSLSSYWGEGYWGYSYSSVATAESFPWNRRDLYVNQSPLFRADQARVPILLTHGAADTNVPRGESDAFYVALQLLGKPVEYLQFDGVDHWVVSHDKRVVWSESIVAWFDRWLKAQPEWWEQLYPSDGEAAQKTGAP